MSSTTIKFLLLLAITCSLCGAKLWDNVISDMSQRMATSKSYESMMQCIRDIPKMIELDFWPLTSDQIADLNHLYEVAFKSEYFTSQSSLVQAMRLIMQQNGVISIDLTMDVWNEFFFRFYKLNQDLKDAFVCKLLFTHIHQDGSRCVPDINTFNIILYGVSLSSQVQDPAHLSDLIFELMQYHKVIPNSQSYQNQFQIYVNAANVLGIAKLILSYPNIQFGAANIDVFNMILAESPIICSILTNPVWVRPSYFIWFIIENSMARHNVGFNLATYNILRGLIIQYPEWGLDDLLKNIRVPGQRVKLVTTRMCKRKVVPKNVRVEVGTVHRVIWRLGQQDIVKGSLRGYGNYIRVTPPHLIGINGRPIIPDATLDLTKTVWDILTKCWRKQLHQYDNVTTDPFVDDEDRAETIKMLAHVRDEELYQRRHGCVNNIRHQMEMTEQGYQCQFRTFVKTKNPLKVSKLLLEQPGIRFDAANIDLFNTLLAESGCIGPLLSDSEIDNAASFITFLIGQSMPKHEVPPDLRTYQIVKDLSVANPTWELDDLLESVKVVPKLRLRHTSDGPSLVPNQIGTVGRVIKRLKQLDLGINTIGHANYIKVTEPDLIGKGGRPVTPDVTLDLSKRDWDVVMARWRKQLHEYDNVSYLSTDPFVDDHKTAEKIIKLGREKHVKLHKRKGCA